jgi:flagellar biosynthesis protein FlhF
VNVKKFVAATSREALKQVRQALGPDALILSTRPVGKNVEIAAMAGEEMAKIIPAAAPVAAAAIAPAATARAPLPAASEQQRVQVFRPPRVDDENVVRGPGGAQHRRAKRAKDPDIEASGHPKPPRAEHMPEPPAEIQGGSAPGQEGSAVMAELKAVRGLLENQLATLAWGESLRRSPLRVKFTRLLLAAGFSPALARGALAKLPDDYSDEQGGKWLAEVLARNVPVVEPEDNLVAQGGVYAIVGPTGVGKTTTTAKLAARCVVRFGADNLALVTTDSYRIGAQEQLRTYGRILGVPVHVVQDEGGLAGAIASLRRKHLVLIDTVGMGQRDSRVIEQVSMLANSGAKRILVLNTTSHGETLEDVVRAFQGKALAGCIISKSDEAVRIGSVLDTVMRHRLRVHFVANGQRVPEDLHEANAQYLVHRALKSPAPAQAFLLSEEDFPLLMLGCDAPAGSAAQSAAHA